MTPALQSLALGQLGSDFVNDTTLHLGHWGTLVVLVPTVFKTLISGFATTNTAPVEGPTLAANTILHGHFIGLQLTSGAVIAYKTIAPVTNEPVVNLGLVDDTTTAFLGYPELITLTGDLYIRNNTALTRVSAPFLQTARHVFVYWNAALVQLHLFSLRATTSTLDCIDNISLLEFRVPALTTAPAILCNGCLALTTVDISSYVPGPRAQVNFYDCALTQASVDHILTVCAASADFYLGQVDLSHGTNATPSDVGPGSAYETLTNSGTLVSYNP